MSRGDSSSEAMGKATAAVAASAQQWEVEEGEINCIDYVIHITWVCLQF